MLKENNDEEINVDLWPSKMWTEKELNEFESVFEEFGEVSGQISDGYAGISFQIGIALAGFVVARFFGAMAKKFGEKVAEDLYDLSKRKILDLALKKESDIDLEADDNCGYIQFNYEDLGRRSTFYYACFYRNEEQLNAFLSSLFKIDSEIKSAYDQKLFPFNKCDSFNFHVELNFMKRKFFTIMINRCVNNLLKTETFHSDIYKWDDFEWSQLIWTTERPI
jgi:hypothetical protein